MNAPLNSRAWSMPLKIYHTYIPSMVGFTVCFASASTVPAQPWLESQFDIGEKASLLPFTLFILGLAFGPVLAAPISEMHGRRPVYILSVLCFMIFVLGAGFSTSLTSLIICRLFAGAFGGSALVVGFGLLSDIWGSSQLPIALSIFNTIPFCGPAIGQLVSSFIVVNKSWPWTQWVTIFLSAFTFVSILPMKETHQQSIERRLQKSVESKSIPRVSFRQNAMIILSTIPLVRPLHMLVQEPVVCLFALYVAFNFAAVYCFSASIPYAFMVAYDFGIEEQGLVFISLVVGYVLSAPTMIFPFRAQIRRQAKKRSSSSSNDEEGQTRPIPLSPEQLLWPAMLGSLALPISFFWFGWSIQAKVHWICPTIALGLFSWGNNLLYNSAQLYLLDTYGPKYGSSATAANNLIRYILAAILPLYMTEMYSRLGTGWAASVLGFILLLFLPIPWAFYRYGPWLRARSKYVTVSTSTGGMRSAETQVDSSDAGESSAVRTRSL